MPFIESIEEGFPLGSIINCTPDSFELLLKNLEIYDEESRVYQMAEKLNDFQSIITSEQKHIRDHPFFKNWKVCRDAVKKYPSYMKYVKESEIFKYPVEIIKIPEFFKYVPERFQTSEVVINALNSDPENVKYCSKKLLESVMDRLNNYNVLITDYIEFLPEGWQTLRNWKSAIERNHEKIMFCPIGLQTTDILAPVIEGIKNHSISLKFVNQKLLDRETCINSVVRDGSEIPYVPEHLLNYDFFEEYFNQDNINIQHIPREYLSNDRIIKAIKSNNRNLMFLEPGDFTSEVMKCIDSEMFRNYNFFIPDRAMNDEFIDRMFKENHETLMYMPSTWHSEEMLEVFKERSPQLVKHII